jgi:hypothetical protein
VENNSLWAVVAPSSGQTPLDLSVIFDAVGFQPGRYTDRLLVDALAPGVDDDPLAISLVLNIESGVTTVPSEVSVIYYPCIDNLPVRSIPVSVSGAEGTPFTAQIAGSPAWAEVDPASGMLPEILTVAVDPSRRPGDFAQANLVLTLDLPNAPGTVERIPIYLLCADQQLHLPAVRAD